MEIKPKNKGYTLIEVMVAVGIFFVLIAAPSSFFVSSIRGQQKVLASQELIDSVSYNLDYISRALRMAKTDTEGSCIDSNANYKLTRGGSGIKFRNYLSVCQEIFLETGQLYESKSGEEAVALTSDDLEVVLFEINSYGWTKVDGKQPKVTIFLYVKGRRGQKPELQPEIKVQTTISQRNLDVIY